MRYKSALLSLLLGAVLCFFTFNASAEQKQDAKTFIDNLLYGELKHIESFGFIYVHIENTESSRLQLNENDLTDYLKLRFKNNFSGVQYKDKTNSLADIKDPKKIGNLWCGVWTVGDDYPVAYHVECQLGSFQKDRILTDAVLGYGSKRNVPDTIRKSIDDIVSRFAVKFFKVRGEM